MVRSDLERLENLVEEMAVLRGHADTDIEPVGLSAEPVDDRAKFDGFRASAEDEKGFDHVQCRRPRSHYTGGIKGAGGIEWDRGH